MQLSKPLTKLQLELLKIYSFGISDEQLTEIKDVLSKYFADKASDEMDKLWEKEDWTNETMDEWLKGDNKKDIDQ